MRRPWHRFRLDGDRVNLMGEPQQNESIDQLTNALDVELWDQPTIATGMAVDLYLCDSDAETIVAQFAGVINHIVAQSSPHHVVLTCTGPLAKLRRVRNTTADLSGMTDGEAIEFVLTYCDIDFDSADIQDAGYVLGAETPIVWTRDTPGSEVIRLLNDAFGMAMIETGAGRVCRFAYDLAPNAATISRTFHRSTDTLYFVGERGRGDLDAIQNVWQIQGASWTDADGCQETVWGRSAATHAKLGVGVNVRSRSFSSEIIQDEALAEAVARRMARWYNREPDEIRIETANDPQLVCGLVIGVDDAVYGMDLTSVKRYTIVGIDRTGPRMTIRGIGGDAGEAGTVTTGVEQLCNQLPDDLNLPGDFELPDISFPPFPDLGDLDLDLDFPPLVGDLPDLGGLIPFPDLSGIGTDPMDGGGGGSGSVCFAPTLGDWDLDVFSVDVSSGNVEFNDGSEDPEIVLTNPAVITDTDVVTWHARIDYSGPGNGVTDEPFTSMILQKTVGGAFAGLQVSWYVDNTGLIELYGFGAGYSAIPVADSLIYAGFDIDLYWSPIADTVGFDSPTLGSNGVVLDASGDMELKFNFASDTAIVLTSTEHDICIDDPSNVLIAHWVITEENVSPTADSLVMDGDASAFNDAITIDPAVDWELSGILTMLPSAGAMDVEIGLAHWTGLAYTSKYALDLYNEGSTTLYLYGPGDQTQIDSGPYSSGDELTFTLSWDASTSTLSIAITDGSLPLSTNLFDDFPPDEPLHVYVRTNGLDDGGMEVSDLTLVIG